MPRSKTELVSFRLDRELVARIDEWARARGSTRTDGTRDLLERGLAAAVTASTPTSAPAAGTLRPKKEQRAVIETHAECGWCGQPRNGPHYEKCPHAPGSGLGSFLRELGRGSG